MKKLDKKIKIEKAELLRIRLPLAKPFETSFGRFEEEEHLIVVLFGEGIKGYGEAPLHKEPVYSYEDTETGWHVLCDLLLPRIVGKKIGSGEDLNGIFESIRGHNTAKAAVEFAFHDLAARIIGIPLWEYYGGINKKIPVGVSIGIEHSVEALVTEVIRYVEEGYKRIKIKIRPGWDLAPVTAIRERFPEIPFTVDANSSYTLKDISLLKQLDKFNLGYIEQPLHWDDLYEHSILQKEIQTPVCLDESIKCPRAMRAAIELRSCRVVNLKPTRVGGVIFSLEILEICRKVGIPVWIGGRLETGIGRLHNIAVATLPGFSLPGDLSASSRYYKEDIIDPPVIVQNGFITPPNEPGLGHEIKEKFIEEKTISKKVFNRS